MIEAKVNLNTRDIFVDTWYDEAGQVERQTIPYQYTTGGGWHTRSGTQPYTLRSYDALGRPVSAVNTDGTTQSFTYEQVEEAGVLYMKTCQKDELGHPTCSLSDVWGRVVRSGPFNAALGPDVEYTYDTLDRLVQVETGGATTTLTYDIAGRKTQMIDPDMGTWNYAYDAIGNLVRQTDAKGQRTCLYYDGLNRLLGKHYRTNDTCPATYYPDDPATFPIRYTYDVGANGIGHRTSMNDLSGSASWSYDGRGRMVSESKVITGSGTFVTSYTYNSADMVASMTYPDNNSGGAGETVSFSYNNQMLLTHSQSTSYTYVNDILYDAAGRVQFRKLGTGPNLTTSYVYYDWTTANGAGRVQNINSGKSAPYTALQQMSYTYQADGNVLTITDYKAGGTQTQTFTYDNLDRLITARASGGSGGTYSVETYEYDPSTGNLENTTPLGNYDYLDSAHKHAVTHLGGVQKYWYDANGNMTRRIATGGTYNYTYNEENHLTGVSGSATATFVYDGDGVRVKGTVGGVTTAYVGSHFEWTGSTTTMQKYYYAGGARVAVRTGTGSPSWLLGDHLGSQALTISYAGTSETGEKRYDAWGEQRYTSGTTPTTFRYTGQRFEESLGIYYYGARWVDPALGRWLSPDTIVPDQYDPESYDRYSYVRNNPVNRVDPTGHKDTGPGLPDEFFPEPPQQPYIGTCSKPKPCGPDRILTQRIKMNFPTIGVEGSDYNPDNPAVGMVDLSPDIASLILNFTNTNGRLYDAMEPNVNVTLTYNVFESGLPYSDWTSDIGSLPVIGPLSDNGALMSLEIQNNSDSLIYFGDLQILPSGEYFTSHDQLDRIESNSSVLYDLTGLNFTYSQNVQIRLLNSDYSFNILSFTVSAYCPPIEILEEQK